MYICACMVMYTHISIHIAMHSIILQYGCTPLFVASQNGYDKIVDVLIIAKADVNIANKVSNIYVYMCM